MKTFILACLVTLSGCAMVQLTTANDFMAQAQAICAESYDRDSTYSSKHPDFNINDPSGRSSYAKCVMSTSTTLSDSENQKRAFSKQQQDSAVGGAATLGIFGALLGLCAAGGC